MTGVEIALGVALAASTAIGAMSAIQQGNAAEKVGRFNAQLAEREARQAEQQARFEEDRLRERHDRLRGSQIAAAAAQGRDINEGSPLLIRAETAEDVELDALAIRYSGSVQAARSRGEAALSRLQGRQARTASRFKAGATILGGATQALALGQGAFAGPTTAGGGVTASQARALNVQHEA